MTIIIYDGSFKKKKSFQVLLQQLSSEIVVPSYCSPMEFHCALKQPHNATVDILAILMRFERSH
jgi:hypothetical protein